MNDKIIGIIGGMGPKATIDLYSKIIDATKIETEQDHFKVIIYSNPKIPDRTKAILGLGESPLDALIETGKALEKLGVEVACIPCITAHYFIEDVQKELSYPILNALVEVNKYIKANYPNVKNVGVLATTGSVKSGIYKKYLGDFNIIYPCDEIQANCVMEAIYGKEGIKNGDLGEKPLSLLKKASEELIENGAEVVISGCTEIILVLKPHHISVPLIDPMDVLAKAVVEYASK
ncbi:MAG TPA: amino acid racemase [Tissierellaceae bacterium]